MVDAMSGRQRITRLWAGDLGAQRRESRTRPSKYRPLKIRKKHKLHNNEPHLKKKKRREGSVFEKRSKTMQDDKHEKQTVETWTTADQRKQRQD